jgi:hypothetical protein
MLHQPPLLAQIALWPLEKQQDRRLAHTRRAAGAPKPSQHRQDQTQAPQPLHCDAQAHPKREPENRAAEARARK